MTEIREKMGELYRDIPSEGLNVPEFWFRYTSVIMSCRWHGGLKKTICTSQLSRGATDKAERSSRALVLTWAHSSQYHMCNVYRLKGARKLWEEELLKERPAP